MYVVSNKLISKGENVLKSNKNKEIFRKLKEMIGKEIICTYYRKNSWDKEEQIQTIKLRLEKVNDYRSIFGRIENKIRPEDYIPMVIGFIWESEFIISIKDLNGNIIYENNNPIEDLKVEYDNVDDLVRKQKLTFGEDYISEEELNSKTYLIKKGLEQLEPTLHEKWLEFVEYYFPDAVIQATLSMLEKVNHGTSFYNAELEVYRYLWSGQSTVDSALSIFLGQEYCDYLQKMRKQAFLEEPSVLTKGKTKCLVKK